MKIQTTQQRETQGANETTSREEEKCEFVTKLSVSALVLGGPRRLALGASGQRSAPLLEVDKGDAIHQEVLRAGGSQSNLLEGWRLFVVVV